MADMFSLADQQQLDALVEKFAPQGIRQLQSDIQQLNAEVNAAKTPAGKDAARRAFWQTHVPCVGDDAEAVRALHTQVYQCGGAESGALGTLIQARQQGLISDDEFTSRSRAESERVLGIYRTRAYDLLTTLAEAGEHVTFASTATDADRQRVMDAFNKGDAWRQTLDRFSQVWDASDEAARAELRQKYPELYQSAIGG